MWVNKDMIVLARESRGMTQAGLAEALGVSQSKVSKYEAGGLAVSDSDLEALCRVFQYTAEFFCQDETIYGFGSPCVYHRKRLTSPIGDLRRLQATVNIRRSQIARLLRSVKVESPYGFHRMDVDAFDGEPATVARMLRKAWSLPIGPVANVVAAVENAGGIVVEYPFDAAKVDAVSQWPPSLPPLFFLNLGQPVDRLRWSLVHEVGHIVMHATPTKEQEEQADKFAAEFLLPAQELKGDFRGRVNLETLASLKVKWRVSIQALARRAHDLNVISDADYRRIFTQMSKLRWRRVEPVQLEPEKPSLLQSIIDTHLTGLGYSSLELSKVLMADESLAREHFFPKPPTGRLRIVK